MDEQRVIDSFTGVNKFLSNFFIEPDGTHIEGEYQAQKCLRVEDIIKFKNLHPIEAKRLGRIIEVRKDWEKVKLEVMKTLVWQKFTDHPSLTKLLLSTQGKILIEGNSWNDTFWGICKGIGQNNLGKILMETREELLG